MRSIFSATTATAQKRTAAIKREERVTLAGRGIYLVGSVPFATSAEVFANISAAFGPRIARIPHGEVGERIDWVTPSRASSGDNPAFEPSDEVFGVHAGATKRRRYRLKAGKAPADVTFGDLGYADNARASYAEFARARNAGGLLTASRFQCFNPRAGAFRAVAVRGGG